MTQVVHGGAACSSSAAPNFWDAPKHQPDFCKQEPAVVSMSQGMEAVWEGHTGEQEASNLRGSFWSSCDGACGRHRSSQHLASGDPRGRQPQRGAASNVRRGRVRRGAARIPVWRAAGAQIHAPHLCAGHWWEPQPPAACRSAAWALLGQTPEDGCSNEGARVLAPLC